MLDKFYRGAFILAIVSVVAVWGVVLAVQLGACFEGIDKECPAKMTKYWLKDVYGVSRAVCLP
jgi:hypothetical protein